MRTLAPKKRPQRRRLVMFGRKLAPSMRKMLQSGRIAKGSRVSNSWTVTTTDPARVTSLATAACGVTALSHRFEPNNRFVVASKEEPGHDVEEESDEEVSRGCGGKHTSRKRRKRRKFSPAVPSREEEESAEECRDDGSAGEGDGHDGVAVGDASHPDPFADRRGSSEEGDSCAWVASDCADVQSRAEVFRTLLASGTAGSPAPSDEGGIDEDGSEDDREDDRHFWAFGAAGGPLVAVLLPPAVVRFVGRARLHVLHGALDVEGHVLVAGSQPPDGRLLLQCGGPLSGPAHLRALPLGDAAVLVGAEGRAAVAPLRRTLSRLGLDHAWPQLQPLTARRGAAVLLLYRALGGAWPEGAGPELRGPHGARGFSLSQQGRLSAGRHHPWRQQVHALARDLALGPEEGSPVPRRVVVCGRQNTGKSSLLRVVANTFLNVLPEVLYLDCDPGQGEFTPPATVSLTRVTKPLLGPPFTHVQTPLKAFFVGHVSPVGQPDAYCRAVQSLLEYAGQVAAPEAPLLVNTMGWVNGLGLSLLVDVLRWVQPTDVVQLVARGAEEVDLPPLDRALLGTACGWGTARSSATGHRRPLLGEDIAFHHLPGATRRARSWARAKREAMVLAYLGQQQHGASEDRPTAAAAAGGAPFWVWNTTPLRVPMSLVAIHDCDNSVPKQQLLRAICGAMVALCVVPTHWMLETEKPGYPKFINHSGPYECLGYGLVRGVDPCRQHLYILTPEPADRLAEVNALVRGDLHLPDSCLAAQCELLQCAWAPYVTRAPRAASCDAGGTSDGESEEHDDC